MNEEKKLLDKKFFVHNEKETFDSSCERVLTSGREPSAHADTANRNQDCAGPLAGRKRKSDQYLPALRDTHKS